MDRTERLENIVEILLENKGFAGKLKTIDFRWLCSEIRPVLLSEPTVLDLKPPIKICGDLHGQFLDLLRVFGTGGFVPENRFLFLGDYVDRGDQSVEVISLLFALKLLYPDNIYLIRGNHESPEMTESFGFLDECIEKLDEYTYEIFMSIFDCLPISALISGKIFCVHGGLSPEAVDIAEIREIERPTYVPNDGALADLLWSDPNPLTEEWGPNDRGATITWGLSAANKFIEANKLTHVVRGHQLAEDGYAFPFYPDKRVVTIFTASCYAGRYANKAAFISVDEDCKLSYTTLASDFPVIKLKRSTSREKVVFGTPTRSDDDDDHSNAIIPGTPRQKGK